MGCSSVRIERHTTDVEVAGSNPVTPTQEERPIEMISWSIEVELDQQDIGPNDVDDLMEALSGGHPAIGTAPNGNLSVRIFTEASTAQDALALGVSTVVEAAEVNGFGTRVLAIDLITEAELDRRLAEDN